MRDPSKTTPLYMCNLRVRVEPVVRKEAPLMATIILLRHGHSAANAKNLLTGRLPGVGLSAEGIRQARELITRIDKPIDYVHISPIERCHLTLAPWLTSKKSSSLKKLEINDGLSEIDFGRWSGKSLTSLRRLPLWKSVQNSPARVTFPDGESFRKASNRSFDVVEKILSKGGNSIHLLVTHADIIKLLTARLMGLGINDFQQIQVSPASFTIFHGNSRGTQLVTINNSSSLSKILK